MDARADTRLVRLKHTLSVLQRLSCNDDGQQQPSSSHLRIKDIVVSERSRATRRRHRQAPPPIISFSSAFHQDGGDLTVIPAAPVRRNIGEKDKRSCSREIEVSGAEEEEGVEQQRLPSIQFRQPSLLMQSGGGVAVVVDSSGSSTTPQLSPPPLSLSVHVVPRAVVNIIVGTQSPCCTAAVASPTPLEATNCLVDVTRAVTTAPPPPAAAAAAIPTTTLQQTLVVDLLTNQPGFYDEDQQAVATSDKSQWPANDFAKPCPSGTLSMIQVLACEAAALPVESEEDPPSLQPICSVSLHRPAMSPSAADEMSTLWSVAAVCTDRHCVVAAVLLLAAAPQKNNELLPPSLSVAIFDLTDQQQSLLRKQPCPSTFTLADSATTVVHMQIIALPLTALNSQQLGTTLSTSASDLFLHHDDSSASSPPETTVLVLSVLLSSGAHLSTPLFAVASRPLIFSVGVLPSERPRQAIHSATFLTSSASPSVTSLLATGVSLQGGPFLQLHLFTAVDSTTGVQLSAAQVASFDLTLALKKTIPCVTSHRSDIRVVEISQFYGKNPLLVMLLVDEGGETENPTRTTTTTTTTSSSIAVFNYEIGVVVHVFPMAFVTRHIDVLTDQTSGQFVVAAIVLVGPSEGMASLLIEAVFSEGGCIEIRAPLLPLPVTATTTHGRVVFNINQAAPSFPLARLAALITPQTSSTSSTLVVLDRDSGGDWHAVTAGTISGTAVVPPILCSEGSSRRSAVAASIVDGETLSLFHCLQ